jgi:putative salt-induced outer membrane protein YdiY
MGLSLAVLVASSLLAEPDAAERAAAAAEKAAAAAQSAAEAAQKTAEAAAALQRSALGGAAASPVAPAAPAAPPPASKWTGTVGVGIVSLTGNARSVTFNASGAAERKSDGWILRLKGIALYGESRAAEGESTETLAKAAGLQARMDRKFHERYSGYLLAALEADHVKSVEARYTGEAGASITWIDAKGEGGGMTSLRTDLGFRWAWERRYQYYPTEKQVDDQTLYAPRLGVAFKHAIDKGVVFTEDAELLPNVVGDSRLVVTSTTKVSARLSSTLALGASLQVNHDSAPAAGKVETDTILGLNLDVLF